MVLTLTAYNNCIAKMVAGEYILSSCKEPGFCGGLNQLCKASTTSAMQPVVGNTTSLLFVPPI